MLLISITINDKVKGNDKGNDQCNANDTDNTNIMKW